VRRIVAAIVLLSAAAVAGAAEEHWFSLHLDGRKIGHMHTLRYVEPDGRVVNEQTLALQLERSGAPLSISTRERNWETPQGVPLAFESQVDTAGTTASVYGDIRPDGRLLLRTEQQGANAEETRTWPRGALLAEGQRLAMEKAGYEPGTEYQLLAWDSGSLEAVPTQTRIGVLELVDIHGRREALLPVEQRVDMGGAVTQVKSWVDPQAHTLRRLRLPAIGLQLEMLACDRACALAPVQPTDVLAQTVVAAPAPLRPRDLERPLRYELRLAAGDGAALDLPPGQALAPLATAGDVALIVDPRGEAAAPPQPADIAPNRWLQADDAGVVALARQATRGAPNERAKAEMLEREVRNFIATKSLRVGYASASEIVKNREGDCTEHAVLLAALLRASGIPARVATGIAYAPAYAGKRDVFVPHAWVHAWVDGAWRGYDAALPRYDAGHIAFGVGDGDPFRFYAGIELLGGVRILGVARASAAELKAAQ
jgi:transglutaminase-like putative cysteine protease